MSKLTKFFTSRLFIISMLILIQILLIILPMLFLSAMFIPLFFLFILFSFIIAIAIINRNNNPSKDISQRGGQYTSRRNNRTTGTGEPQYNRTITPARPVRMPPIHTFRSFPKRPPGCGRRILRFIQASPHNTI